MVTGAQQREAASPSLPLVAMGTAPRDGEVRAFAVPMPAKGKVWLLWVQDQREGVDGDISVSFDVARAMLVALQGALDSVDTAIALSRGGRS